MRFASNWTTAALGAALLLAAWAPAGCRSKGEKSDQGSLRGRVSSANSRPLPGAMVTLGRESVAPGSQVTSAVSGADGGFHLQRVPAGRYVLRAQVPGYAATALVVELLPGDDLRTALRLEPEQLLEGVVHDRRDKPVPDARLFAWPSGRRGTVVVEAHSGKDGRFTLAGLPRGTWAVLVEAPGIGTLELQRVEVPGRRLVLRLDGEGRTLGGLVLGEDGKPRPGARVLLGGNVVLEKRETISDERGAFLFGGLGHGKFVLRASHDNQVALGTFTIDARTGWVPPARLTLSPGGFVEGKTLDDRGAAIPNAVVEALGMPTDDLPELVAATADGHFRVGPLPIGSYRLAARASGHAGATASIRLRPDTIGRIELRLPRIGRVSGRIVNEAGGPVGAVTITATGVGVGQDEIAVLPGSLPLAAEAAELPAHQVERRGPVRHATTDLQGRFVLDELAPGKTKIELTHPERLTTHPEPVFLQPGQLHVLADITMPTGVLFTGTARDWEGNPLAGTHIEARQRKKGGAGLFFVTTSEKDGQFSLRLPDGDYGIAATLAGYVPARISLRADGKSPNVARDLRLAQANAIIEGEVKDRASGHAVSRAKVVAKLPPIDEIPPTGTGTQEPPLATVTTDAAGRFRLEKLPSGSVLLEISHPDFPGVTTLGKSGSRAVVDLERAGGVEGEIRDAASGAFVSRYSLDAAGPAGSRPVETRLSGAGFEVLGMRPGKWNLKVRAPGYAPYEKEVEVPAGTARNKPSLRNVRLDLKRPAGAGP